MPAKTPWTVDAYATETGESPAWSFMKGLEGRDKAEAIANDLALLLNDWRQKTNDVIPSEFAGTRISERYTETYQRIHGRALTSRSAIAAERGIEDEHS